MARNTKKEEMNESKEITKIITDIGRFTEIEKANRILLERMTTIMQGSNRVAYNSTPSTSGLVMHKRSLNSEVRKKELMKITIENQAMLRRL
jgi:hypothetical protein